MNPSSPYLGNTEKLYENNSEGYVYDFEAAVLDVIETDRGCALELDRTAFFPEGGGQGADRGTISGAEVTDVQIENGRILHFVAKRFEKGASVHCSVDRAVRFPRMQNHSGEHIVSGLIHSLYGIENVGFHMSENEMTVDTSAPLTDEMVKNIEKQANAAVWENKEIRCTYPSPEALAAMEYRSKTELLGDVRIVEIDGVDKCACCAPHVRYTGEIGSIHIKSYIKYKKGSRLTLVCGEWASENYMKMSDVTAKMSHTLSAPLEELYEALMKKEAVIFEKLGEIRTLKEKLLRARLAEIKPTDENVCIFETDCDMGLMRKLVNEGVDLTSGVFAAFSKKAAGGYTYVIGTKSADLSPLLSEMSATLGGRGGGKGNMITGYVDGDESAIREFFEKFEL